ncbi:SDR family oxidoreductase [Salicola sp. Rm-C-2C1-2]|uniref:UDP-glucose 4-epimerase family protein n=1 Tax=Salicola sp. Rm-C-2C1-2 TaxID=3141321 RepID=UPI0032E3E0F2
MDDKSRILVTGATGFIGTRLLPAILKNTACYLTAAVRSQAHFSEPVTVTPVGELDANTDWYEALQSVDYVIHLAARVHVMNDNSADPLHEFRHTNVEGTRSFAKQAASAGVKRFIFVSSIKVNGEFTEPGQPFTVQDEPSPKDPYGQSKTEAEEVLRSIAAETNMEVVIIRPPLIYGPGVKANFAAMMNWLNRGIPLPLGLTENVRSFLALDNLVDLIITCLDHPNAANQTFLASDGEDVSTTQLLQKMSAALGRKARLVPVPPALMRFGAKLARREDIYQRLFGSLQLDICHTRETLDWTPPLSLDEGLQQTADAMEKR